MGIDANKIFSLKEVPGSIRKELDARSETKVKQWHAAKKPWVHIMSLAANCAYDKTTQFGLRFGPGGGSGYIANFERPQPTVDSISVKKLGELGTTRKVTITLKAYTDEQLNNIAKCYFIPGMSVRVQYGWNIDANGANAPSPFTTIKGDPEAIAQIQSTQANYPNYDGLQGIINNYNASLDDNVWNITIDVVGAGTAVGGMKTSNISNGCICKVKPEPKQDGSSEEGEEVNTKVSNLKAALIVVNDDYSKKSDWSYGGKCQQVYRYGYNGYDRDEFGREDTGGAWYTLGFGDGIGYQKASYISLGALQRLISCTTQQVRSNKEPAVMEYNSDGVVIAKPAIALCADPRIAYIPGGNLKLGAEGGFAPTAISGDSIILDNILFNVTHVLKVLRSEEKAEDSVQNLWTTLLKDLNYNCGNAWEFELVNTSDAEPLLTKEKAPVRISIMDVKKTTLPNSAFQIKANSKNSCVRSVKLDMKLTDAMKTQALYSDNPPNNSDPCNSRFAAFTQLSGDNLAHPKATQDPPKGCNSSPCEDSNKEPSFSEKFKKLQDGVTDDTVQSVLGEMQSQKKKDQEKICNGSILPLEFSVVLDGIGGFSFGQSIQCDRFPQGYTNFVAYSVTSVEHSISADDWTTTVNTIGRRRS